jgi:hypothetical protein
MATIGEANLAFITTTYRADPGFLQTLIRQFGAQPVAAAMRSVEVMPKLVREKLDSKNPEDRNLACIAVWLHGWCRQGSGETND